MAGVFNSVAKINSKSEELSTHSKLPVGGMRQGKKLFDTNDLPLVVLGRSWKVRKPREKDLYSIMTSEPLKLHWIPNGIKLFFLPR